MLMGILLLSPVVTFSKTTQGLYGAETSILQRKWGVEWVVREGVGAWGRNDPSLVCTYE
jgi:hypothetical protein